jgi:hypothetical protein
MMGEYNYIYLRQLVVPAQLFEDHKRDKALARSNRLGKILEKLRIGGREGTFDALIAGSSETITL